MMKAFKLSFFVSFLLLLKCDAFAQMGETMQHSRDRKIFSFGLIADVQFADADKAGKRDYRTSVVKLERCIDELNSNDLTFTISLGDIIDRDYSSFDKPLSILERSKVSVYHVIGNHEFSVDEKYKSQVRKRLNNKRGYFHLKERNFDFIMLDGSDVSLFGHKKGSKAYEQALVKLEELKARGFNNATTWNGGIGERQMHWFQRKLEKAERSNRKVLLFCHWPLLPENGTQLWNNHEVLDMINSYACVVAWISGHHHEGSYQKAGNIHHLTIKGMVEAQSETSCGIMEVYPDKLILNGFGDQPDQVIEFLQ